MPETVIQQNITVEDGGQLVTVLKHSKYLTKMPHFRIFNEGLTNVILDEDLTQQDFKVLLYVLNNMEYENLFQQSQGAIAEALGMQQPNISKAMKKLIAKDFIRIIGNIGRQNVYRISPYLALKSRAKNLAPMLTEWDGIETA
ncbi:helix-turn-helix domain-containing protein [Synechocystis sp. PCC 7338]|uniref:MarR family transcriptional regulator n=1 Tax=Synechocystis sp. PCC 7338 TaxID=2732530 RepID=UPI001BB05349|nr:helix-turn-helix domain-containing protein [Synechocystis sp. PCC 7338]QUS62605.1 MarR family transcriptional regulator [Synechocystis sp. PCC 7338]